MRRPSRQGLLPLCTNSTTPYPGPVQPESKGKFLSLYDYTLHRLRNNGKPYVPVAFYPRSPGGFPVEAGTSMVAECRRLHEAAKSASFRHGDIVCSAGSLLIASARHAIKRKQKFFPTWLFAIATLVCHGQDVRSSLRDYFSEVRAGKHPSMSTVVAPNGDVVTFLEGLQPYLIDSADAVRAKAYELTFRISSPSPNSGVRQRAVDILMHACSGKPAAGAEDAPEFLTRFHKEDFSPSARDSLRKYVRSSVNPGIGHLMKLAGYLGLRDLEPDIWQRSQPGNPIAIRWAAMLSLARLGNSEATAAIMKRVSKFPVNDDVVYELFPDLLYTRQPEAIAYMIAALQSDDPNCLSADAEKEKPIPCGYRIMELLAPVIAGYPLQVDQSGDLATSDYPKALQTVRAWFNHSTAYQILTDKY